MRIFYHNLETVKVKLSEITSLSRRFTGAHYAYNATLVEESPRQESVLYFAKIENSLAFSAVQSMICYVSRKARLQR